MGPGGERGRPYETQPVIKEGIPEHTLHTTHLTPLPHSRQRQATKRPSRLFSYESRKLMNFPPVTWR